MPVIKMDNQPNAPISVEVSEEIYKEWLRGNSVPLYKYLMDNKLPPFDGGGNEGEKQ